MKAKAKTTLLFLCIFICIFALFVVKLIFLFFPKKAKQAVAYVIHIFGKSIRHILGVKVKLSGQKHLLRRRGVLFVCNHLSYIDGIVMDPYMGSGTVAVVARNHGRHFVGAELDEEYFKVATRRLKGDPDKNGCFPNLKTLRDYVEKTGESIEKFQFDVQVGKKPTERSKAKIYPEDHHLQELEERLEYEESAFGADMRGEERPIDTKSFLSSLLLCENNEDFHIQ